MSLVDTLGIDVNFRHGVTALQSVSVRTIMLARSKSIMVKEISKDGNTYYLCGICILAYRERHQAEECEKACNDNT